MESWKPLKPILLTIWVYFEESHEWKIHQWRECIGRFEGCFQALRVLFAILRSYGLLYLGVKCMKQDVSWALPQWFSLGVIT